MNPTTHTAASRGVGAATALALAGAGFAVACAVRATRERPQRTPRVLDDVVDQIRAGKACLPGCEDGEGLVQ